MGAKSANRRSALGAARKRKEIRFTAAKARGDVGGRSKYAKKIQRKMGSGTIDPRWMWYAQRAG